MSIAKTARKRRALAKVLTIVEYGGANMLAHRARTSTRRFLAKLNNKAKELRMKIRR